jgi:hypothetical protein
MKVLKSQQNVGVTLKIEGEPVLKNVTLRPTDERGVFAVLNGRRGRPRLVHESYFTSIKVTGRTVTPREKKTRRVESKPVRRVVRRAYKVA